MLFVASLAFGQKASELKYIDAQELMLINQGFDNTELYYSRLPEDMKSRTRKAVWDLGLNSTGLAVRFSSDAKCIGAKWTLLNNFHMSHMPGTGIRGIDLYTLDNGKWYFIGTAKPNGKESQNVFVRNMAGEMREYVAYLPLYDGVTKVEFGVDSTAAIGMPKEEVLTKYSAKAKERKPILFYGTSITQGGCASRPGMIYSSIIGREYDCEAINLGFSGNARMDFSMAETIVRVDASAYVINCLPNCTAQIVRDSAYRFITTIADAHPDRPIFMVENFDFPYLRVDLKSAGEISEMNAEWEKMYKQLKKEKYKNIKYIRAVGLTGDDAEQTVDGCHMTDLGFKRVAEAFMKYIK